MIRNHHRRRGVTMALLVVALAVLAGIFTVLGLSLVSAHKQHRQDALDRAARNVADSVAELVRSDVAGWRGRAHANSTGIDIAPLLPANATGTVAIAFAEDGQPRIAVVSVVVEGAHSRAKARRVVELP